MKKSTFFYAFGFMALLLSIYAFRAENLPAPVEETPLTTFKWYTLEEAMAANKKAPKKFFIDVYTDWCGWCKVMDRETFAKEDVQSYLATHFYPVKLDAEQREAITFKGKNYQYRAGAGRRGIHELAYELLKARPSYPTIVYLDEALNPVHYTNGFKKQAQLEPELKFVAEEQYKTKVWQPSAKR